MPKIKAARAHLPRVTMSHTTKIEPVGKMMKGMLETEGVRRIVLGKISPVGRSAEGRFRVKFSDIVGGTLLIVRGNFAIQEVRVYSHSPNKSKTALARLARNHNMSISFKDGVEQP